MQALPEIAAFADDLTAIRQDIHRNPELGFEEHRTAGLIADRLESWGITVTRGIGGTGVVGVLDGRGPGPVLGLRADMDALPMEEATGLPYSSSFQGRFHGCGHDGHVTMLLGAARYLAMTRQFDGRVVFIFQPAEEGLGGALAMLEDELFDRFPCDALYGLHNAPELAFGQLEVTSGPAMAGAERFDITITGKGCHGAKPQSGRDPLIAGVALVQSLQTIVSRNLDARHPAVLSVTEFRAGTTWNVIPDTSRLSGTFRFFAPEVRDQIMRRMTTLCDATAAGYDVTIEVSFQSISRILINDEGAVRNVLMAASDVLGDAAASRAALPVMGSEDMGDLLAAVPGAFFRLGHGTGIPLHNPGFRIDDRILPLGASIFARLVERSTGSSMAPTPLGSQ